MHPRKTSFPAEHPNNVPPTTRGTKRRSAPLLFKLLFKRITHVTARPCAGTRIEQRHASVVDRLRNWEHPAPQSAVWCERSQPVNKSNIAENRRIRGFRNIKIQLGDEKLICSPASNPSVFARPTKPAPNPKHSS